MIVNRCKSGIKADKEWELVGQVEVDFKWNYEASILVILLETSDR